MTVVYKVVRRTRYGHRYSAIVRGRGIQLCYQKGKVVEAPDGRPPLAFDSKLAAKDFARFYGYVISKPRRGDSYHGRHTIEVWEAEATKVKPQPTVTCNWDSLACVKLFWELWHKGKDIKVSGSTPPGTVSCQTIKLVRKVA